MKLLLPNLLVERIKQLTWLAGRKSTPVPWMRNVWFTEYGAAATDGYVAGWVPSGGALNILADNKALAPDAGELRSTIGKAERTPDGTVLELGEPAIDRNLLKVCVSRAHQVRATGHRVSVDAADLKDRIDARSKLGGLRYHLDPTIVLHVPTTRRALRQYKDKGQMTLHYLEADRSAVLWTQDPATGIELMWENVHPSIDPGDEA